MGRHFNRIEGPDAAPAVTPRHSRWSGVMDTSMPPSPSPATSLPAAGRLCCPVAGPTAPPRAGDTLKPWNNKATIYGGMP